MRSHAVQPDAPADDGHVDRTPGVRPDPVQPQGGMVAGERVAAAGERRAPGARPRRVTGRAPAIHANVQRMQQPALATVRDRAAPEPERAQLLERDHPVLPCDHRPDAPIDVLDRPTVGARVDGCHSSMRSRHTSSIRARARPSSDRAPIDALPPTRCNT
jgi:hypothetical protein